MTPSQFYDMSGGVAIFAIILSLLLFFLTLFGVFERRKEGQYVFRYHRALLAFLAFFLLNVFMAAALISALKEVMVEASQVGELATNKNRTIKLYELHQLNVMFPEAIKTETIDCYKAGLSNFIEDQWPVSFVEGIHDKDPEQCSKYPADCTSDQVYVDAARRMVNPHRLMPDDMKVIYFQLGNTWITAAEMYKTTRRLFHVSDSKGKPPEPAPPELLKKYHEHLNNCRSYTPQFWIIAERPLITSKAGICFGSCP